LRGSSVEILTALSMDMLNAVKKDQVAEFLRAHPEVIAPAEA
jgi:hypothetical protein